MDGNDPSTGILLAVLGITAVGLVVLIVVWRQRGSNSGSGGEGGGGGRGGGGGGGTYIAPPDPTTPGAPEGTTGTPSAVGCASGYGIADCYDGTTCTQVIGRCADGCAPRERKDGCGTCVPAAWVEANPGLCQDTLCPSGKKKDKCDTCQDAEWVGLNPTACFETGCPPGMRMDGCRTCQASGWVADHPNLCLETGCASGLKKDGCNQCRDASWVTNHPLLCFDTQCALGKIKDACDTCQDEAWVNLPANVGLCKDTGCQRGYAKDACMTCQDATWVAANSTLCRATMCPVNKVQDGCGACVLSRWNVDYPNTCQGAGTVYTNLGSTAASGAYSDLSRVQTKDITVASIPIAGRLRFASARGGMKTGSGGSVQLLLLRGSTVLASSPTVSPPRGPVSCGPDANTYTDTTINLSNTALSIPVTTSDTLVIRMVSGGWMGVARTCGITISWLVIAP